MRSDDWGNRALRLLVAELRMASGTPEYAPREGAIIAVFNSGEEAEVTLPQPPEGKRWDRSFDTSDQAPQDSGISRLINGNSVVAFVLESEG